MKKQFIITFVVFLSITVFVAGEELFKDEKLLESTNEVELTNTAIPVAPGKKYKISFIARTNSKYTIEANERVRIMNLRYIATVLRMRFFDQDGKKFSRNYIDIPVITQQFYHYARVFYPPSKARLMKVFLLPRKDSDIAVKDVVISSDLDEKESKCVNVHPTFEYGALNLYGYTIGAGGMFYIRPDGKTVWKTGFLGYTPAFPVKENTYYDVFCKAKKYRGRKSWILLECYNAKARRPFKTMKVAFSDKGEHTKLKIPANTVYSKLRCYCVILEEFNVTEGKKNRETLK